MKKTINSSQVSFLAKLEEKIKVRFKNKGLLKTALTHRSWLNENHKIKAKSNERLEFLGDAVLELWATKTLFLQFPRLNEGHLTNIRAAIVRTESLAKKGKELHLGEFLFLSKGEEKTGGRNNTSLLANTFEALVGAIYCDQGNKVEKFLDELLLKDLLAWGKKGDAKDCKTLLQEKAQTKLKLTPHYQLIRQKGPDHNRTFTTAVLFGDKKICLGKGKSKKESEESAARKALTILAQKGTINGN